MNNTMNAERVLPRQFKPERPIEDGPFYPWVKLAMRWFPDLKRSDLDPNEADLELISRLAYQNDELANQLAAEIMKNGLLANELEKGLSKGLASLENPPQILADYLAYYEALPEFLERYQTKNKKNKNQKSKQNQSSTMAINDVPVVLGDAVAMSVGFFVGANYPAVGKSIVSTGSVASGSNRMVQTLNFVGDVYGATAFELFGSGIQACAKVRLAHAFARMQIERKGDWDTSYYGLPISEFDNMIFLSGVFASVVLRSGGDASLIESRVRGIQYGLGAPKELLELNAAETFRFFNMCLAHLDDSPETAREVVKNFYENEYFRPTDTLKGKINRELSLELANLLSRVLFGNKMADDIGLGRWYRNIYLPWVAISLRAVSTVGVRRMELILKIYMLAYKILKKASVTKPVKANRVSTKRKQKDKKSSYIGSFGVFKGL